MKLFVRLACSLAVVSAIFVASEHDAKALGPIDLEAGLKIGAGTNPDSAGPNPYGFGLGARAGVGIFNLWLGASAIHYFGGSKDLPGVGKDDVSTNLVGGEVGYTIGFIPLLQIRPLIGIGDAMYNTSVTSEPDTTKGHIYLEPGLTVLVPLGLMFVGADASALLVPGVDQPTATNPSATTTYTSFTFHGQVGIRL